MNPFAHSSEDRIDSLGESALIENIKNWLGPASPDSPVGIGDDCSSVSLPRDESYLLTTTDPVIYQRHFDDSLTPEDVAIKLLNRNISDIASMGGTPRHATLSLAIPNNLSIDWLQRFYSSLSIVSRQKNIQVNGGDVSPTQDFIGAFMTLVGYGNNRVLERKKANPNALLFVTGSLGGSRLSKHYTFEPRVAEGQWLVKQSAISSCMDLSDGLGKDCDAFVSENCCAQIDSHCIPISEDAYTLSKSSGRTPLDHAINDGEDYELLFTLEDKQEKNRFKDAWNQQFNTPITQIGHITERNANQPCVIFSDLGNEINLTGYDPFRSA